MIICSRLEYKFSNARILWRSHISTKKHEHICYNPQIVFVFLVHVLNKKKFTLKCRNFDLLLISVIIRTVALKKWIGGQTIFRYMLEIFERYSPQPRKNTTDSLQLEHKIKQNSSKKLPPNFFFVWIWHGYYSPHLLSKGATRSPLTPVKRRRLPQHLNTGGPLPPFPQPEQDAPTAPQQL